MIKINLLPSKELKKASKKLEFRPSKEIVKKIIIPLLVTVFILGVIFAHCEITKLNLKEDITKQRKVLDGLQKKIAEVKKFETINKDMETKTKLIENLKKMQSAPLNILNNVVKKLPDGVWLTGLSYDGAITVEGLGLSNLNIVAFVENLKAVPEFINVALVESQQTEYEKQQVYKFIVKFNLKV